MFCPRSKRLRASPDRPFSWWFMHVSWNGFWTFLSYGAARDTPCMCVGFEGDPPARCSSSRAVAQRDREDGIEGFRSSRLGTAGDSVESFGLLEVSEPDPRSGMSEFVNSSMGVACARSASAAGAPFVAGVSSLGSSGPSALCVAPALHALALHALALHALAFVSPMHGARNSVVSGGLMVCAEIHKCLWPGSHGQEEGPKWGFQSSRKFASCLRGGVRGEFSAGWPSTGAGCCALSRAATSTRFLTWTRIGHQAINGLEDGVWYRRVRGLGGEG